MPQSMQQLDDPDHVIRLVLEFEQSVLSGREPELASLERLPKDAVLRSPILLRAGAVRLMLDGRLREAIEWTQAAVRGFALQADHREMLAMIGLLALIHVRIGDFTETETILIYLDEETRHDPDSCGGYVWWALARGMCWVRTSAFLTPRSAEEDFAEAADRFRASGDAVGFSCLLLDRWMYDGEGMQEAHWARSIGELQRWAALRPECAAAAAVIAGEALPALSQLPYRYGYMYQLLQNESADKNDRPEGELRYDVEVQLFAGLYHASRKLAEGDRTDAAAALRQMELLQGEMSTPRTAARIAEMKEKVGPSAGYAPFAPHLAQLPDDAAEPSRDTRLRIQLMSGIRMFHSDGASVHPKWKRRKSRELLVYLLLQPDYRALRDQVVEQLFGEGEPAKLANHLYVSLHELRSALAGIGYEDAIEVGGGLIGFRDTVIEVVDVEQYMTLSRVGDQLWTNDKEAAAMLYMDAVRLYGLLGADMPSADWIERWRAQLLERQTQMLRRLGEYYASLAEDSHTEQWLSAWIELRPDQEEAYQAMIRYWRVRGRHAEAVSWYRRLERVCREELETEPLEETKRLIWEA